MAGLRRRLTFIVAVLAEIQREAIHSFADRGIWNVALKTYSTLMFSSLISRSYFE
jgi:hypothetical protein